MKNLPYIQTEFASTAADPQALNVSQLVETFSMAAALTGLPVWQLHSQPQPGRENFIFFHLTQKSNQQIKDVEFFQTIAHPKQRDTT